MKKTVLASFTILCLLSTLFLIGYKISARASPDLPVHNIDTGLDYGTIQEAINAANPGDEIYVRNGTYYEHIAINKQNLTIRGEDRETTIIDGQGNGTVPLLALGGQYNAIEEFSFSNGGAEYDFMSQTFRSAISITGSNNVLNHCLISRNRLALIVKGDNNIVENCVFEENDCIPSFFKQVPSELFHDFAVIFVDRGNHTIVQENVIRNNSGFGISIRSMGKNVIRGNHIHDNFGGISLLGGKENLLTQNMMEDNQLNFYYWWPGKHNYIDATNTINGRPVYVWFNVSDSAVPTDAGYVALMYCHNITLKDFNISNNFRGINLCYTSNSTIEGVNVDRCGEGISFKESSFNLVKNCSIRSNWFGIGLDDGSHDNLFLDNYLENNKENVVFEACSDYYANEFAVSNVVDDKMTFTIKNQRDIELTYETLHEVGLLMIINSTKIRIRDSPIPEILLVDVKGSEMGNISSRTISLLCSNSTEITNCKLRNGLGVRLDTANDVLLKDNDITQCLYGTYSFYCENVSLHSNFISRCLCGFTSELTPVENLKINNNTIEENFVGVYIYNGGPDDRVYHNNFLNNFVHGYSEHTRGTFWDSGYPSGGNYWSGYNGTDFYSGPYQNETGSDGIGDTPYVIDAFNQDNYPLMYPSGSEMEEVWRAYRNLLVKYSDIRSDLDVLNSTIHRLLGDITDLQGKYDSLLTTISNMQEQLGSLNSTCKNLQELIYDLIISFNSTRDNLQDQIDNLEEQVDLLVSTIQEQIGFLNSTFQTSISILQSDQQAIIGELSTIRNLMYVFIATTIILIATTVYLAIRKPKIKP